jgi:hypothetical protein
VPGDRDRTARGPPGEPILRDLGEALIAVYGTGYGIHDPTWISRFTEMTPQAASYRDGRLLPVGDAAHEHCPAVAARVLRNAAPQIALRRASNPTPLNAGHIKDSTERGNVVVKVPGCAGLSGDYDLAQPAGS